MAHGHSSLRARATSLYNTLLRHGSRRSRITVNWDDESGLSMKTKPGLIAFVSNIQLYSLLAEEEKMLAETVRVEYAPLPYMWIENCKGNITGLGLVTQRARSTRCNRC